MPIRGDAPIHLFLGANARLQDLTLTLDFSPQGHEAANPRDTQGATIRRTAKFGKAIRAENF
jgi:hypothetical protein